MAECKTKKRNPRSRNHAVQRSSGIRLSPRRLDEYLNALEESGCAPMTLQSYRRNLNRLYQFLGEDKYIQAETLREWQDSLLESGYSSRTVNVCTTAANGLMLHLGYGELQAGRLPEEENIQQELTRAEYLRLLSAARMLGKEKTYLLVKVFATTGLSVSELKNLTAEVVQAGRAVLPSGILRLPDGLRGELLHFMEEKGIASGPVFLSRDGRPQGRTVLTNMIKALCQDARVSEEKANPRCLRGLYRATQTEIRENLTILVEQTYDRLLEKEQAAIGWEAVPVSRPDRRTRLPGRPGGGNG